MKVVADSSFYICFLDDIRRPKYLIRIIKNFEFLIGEILENEIRQSQNYFHVKNFIGTKIILFDYKDYFYGELLKPLFSVGEIRKGEHEVIAITVIIFSLHKKLISIIDDKEAIKFIEKNFPKIYNMVIRTVRFVEKCCCEYKIFSKKEAKEILNLIKNSKFRVNDDIIEKVIQDIDRC